MTAKDFLTNENFKNLNYKMDISRNRIKVIGVGGGGGNAVANMHRYNVNDVDFVVCNTDAQALQNSPVSRQILLGDNGLGAGNDPEMARQAALESMDEIKAMLIDNPEGKRDRYGELIVNTKMAFITAGMGGGTGTGAAPVIAQACHELGILTVGIVTIPFDFEPPKKVEQALAGIERMSPFLDSLLVIRNDQIPVIFPELRFSHFMKVADEILSRAAISIVDIITQNGYVNVDFADVWTTLKNGGRTIMNFGRASGENRVADAIQDAIESPLLFDYNIKDTRKILIAIYCSYENEISAAETAAIREFMSRLDSNVDLIWGAFFDDTLGDEVQVTLLATCADDSVLPEEIKRVLENKKETSRTITERASSLLHFYDEDLLRNLQNEPAYMREN